MAHVDRWFVATAAEGTARAALLVVDVDLDDALPVMEQAPVLSVVGSGDAGAWRVVRTADAAAPDPRDAPSSADVLGVFGAQGPFEDQTVVATDAAHLAVDAGDGSGPADAADEDPEARRRARLGRSVARAISAQVRPGDAVARIDAGRFAVLRGSIADGGSARAEAAALARGVEDALVGRPEGFGVRVTAGAVTLAADAPREGRSALGAVTTAMLEGKLLTDDRVVVAVAPGG